MVDDAGAVDAGAVDSTKFPVVELDVATASRKFVDGADAAAEVGGADAAAEVSGADTAAQVGGADAAAEVDGAAATAVLTRLSEETGAIAKDWQRDPRTSV